MQFISEFIWVNLLERTETQLKTIILYFAITSELSGTTVTSFTPAYNLHDFI